MNGVFENTTVFQIECSALNYNSKLEKRRRNLAETLDIYRTYGARETVLFALANSSCNYV